MTEKRYNLKAVAQATGIDQVTLRIIAESGKVPFLGALKVNARTHYTVERKGYEAYLNGSQPLDIGKILKEIQDEHDYHRGQADKKA